MVGKIFADDGELHTDGVLDLEGIFTFDDCINLTLLCSNLLEMITPVLAFSDPILWFITYRP